MKNKDRKSVGIVVHGGIVDSCTTNGFDIGVSVHGSGAAILNTNHANDQLHPGSVGTRIEGGGGNIVQGGGTHNFDTGVEMKNTSNNKVIDVSHSRDGTDGKKD